MLRRALLLSSLLLPSVVGLGQGVPTGPQAILDQAVAPVETIPDPHSRSQSNSGMSLADLESLALRTNPTLAAAAARMTAARGRQLQAGLYPNPVAGYHATEIGNLGTAGQQGGFVAQQIVTGGKLRLDQAIVGREFAEAHFLYHAQQQRVLSDVRVRFYEALVAQQRVELTRELADIGDELVRATRTLIEQRLETENDLLQAEILADESHILLENAQNENVEAWRRLTAVLGLPELEPIRLNGSLDQGLPYLDWDQCYAMVLGNNPELLAARARVQRANIVIQRARREPIPNVDVSVSVRHHNVSSSDVANVQVGIPVPVFDKNQGNIRAAQAELVVAGNEVRHIELRLQDQLAVAYRRYVNARQQVERYSTRMVARAQRSLDLVTTGYERGQVTYLTLLTAQQTYTQVNLSYLDALRELREASSLIESQLFRDSLGVRQ